MSVFILSVGLVVRRGDRTWRYERKLEDETLVFVDQLTGQYMSLTMAVLWRKLQAKELAVVSSDSASADSGQEMPLITDWSTLAPALSEAAARQLAYVRDVQRAGLTRGMRRAIKCEIQKIAHRRNDDHPPSDSAVMRWMRTIDDADGAPSALIARRAFQRRSRRKSSVVIDAAREAIRTHYCTRSRPSLADTKIHLDRLLKAKVSCGELSKEEAAVSMSTLRRLKSEVDPYRLTESRFGAAFARNHWRYSLKGNATVRAMQRYEVDHTILDMVAVCDRTGLPLGRPTLTVVIDAYSGYVVGFFLSFWGTGLATTFCALKVALSPKDDYLQGAQLSQPWLGMGLPELLVMDNGLEFHSNQFRLVALHLGIDLLYCAVRQPWLKPHVERVLGALHSRLPSAGRIRKSLNNEVPLDPRETAAITFSALCQGVLKALVEVHALQPNLRKLARPFDLFAEGLAELPPPALPTSLEELDIIVAPSKSLTVGNEGVVSDYLRFNSPELQQLRRSTAERFKTLVKFNPEDLSFVYVQDLRSKRWLAVPCCWAEYATGLSLVQHRAIRLQARDQLSRRGAEEALMRAKTELADFWQSGVVAGRRLKGAQLRGLARLTSSHALRDAADAQPIPVPKPRLLAQEEMAVVDARIPDFDTFEM